MTSKMSTVPYILLNHTKYKNARHAKAGFICMKHFLAMFRVFFLGEWVVFPEISFPASKCDYSNSATLSEYQISWHIIGH